MAFCSKCGREIVDSSIGCPDCDAVTPIAREFIEEPATEPVYGWGNYEENSYQNDASNNEKKGISKGLIFGGAGGLVVIAAIVIALVLVLGGGYKKAIKTFLSVYSRDFTVETIRECAPDEYWEYKADASYDGDYDDMFEFYTDELMENYRKYDAYSFDLDYEIIDKKGLSEKKLNEISDCIEDVYDTNFPEITEGYSFSIDVYGFVTYQDNDEIDRGDRNFERDLVAVKMDGKWYLLYTSEGDSYSGHSTYYYWLINKLI